MNEILLYNFTHFYDINYFANRLLVMVLQLFDNIINHFNNRRKPHRNHFLIELGLAHIFLHIEFEFHLIIQRIRRNALFMKLILYLLNFRQNSIVERWGIDDVFIETGQTRNIRLYPPRKADLLRFLDFIL